MSAHQIASCASQIFQEIEACKTVNDFGALLINKQLSKLDGKESDGRLLPALQLVLIQWIRTKLALDEKTSRSLVLENYGLNILPEAILAHVLSFEATLPRVAQLARVSSFFQKTIVNHESRLITHACRIIFNADVVLPPRPFTHSFKKNTLTITVQESIPTKYREVQYKILSACQICQQKTAEFRGTRHRRRRRLWDIPEFCDYVETADRIALGGLRGASWPDDKIFEASSIRISYDQLIAVSEDNFPNLEDVRLVGSALTALSTHYPEEWRDEEHCEKVTEISCVQPSEIDLPLSMFTNLATFACSNPSRGPAMRLELPPLKTLHLAGLSMSDIDARFDLSQTRAGLVDMGDILIHSVEDLLSFPSQFPKMETLGVIVEKNATTNTDSTVSLEAKPGALKTLLVRCTQKSAGFCAGMFRSQLKQVFGRHLRVGVGILKN